MYKLMIHELGELTIGGKVAIGRGAAPGMAGSKVAPQVVLGFLALGASGNTSRSVAW